MCTLDLSRTDRLLQQTVGRCHGSSCNEECNLVQEMVGGDSVGHEAVDRRSVDEERDSQCTSMARMTQRPRGVDTTVFGKRMSDCMRQALVAVVEVEA